MFTLKMYETSNTLSQKQLAQQLYDVSVRTIRCWILNEKEPSIYVQKLVLHQIKID